MCVYVGMCTTWLQKPEKAMDPLKLELQVFVSHLMSVLGLELRSFNCWVITVQPHYIYTNTYTFTYICIYICIHIQLVEDRVTGSWRCLQLNSQNLQTCYSLLDRVCCSPCWPWTCCVATDVLELLASGVLRLQMSSTRSHSCGTVESDPGPPAYWTSPLYQRATPQPDRRPSRWGGLIKDLVKDLIREITLDYQVGQMQGQRTLRREELCQQGSEWGKGWTWTH